MSMTNCAQCATTRKEPEMTVATEPTAARKHRSAIGSLRLRLKPAHRYCGFVQGAWWPRSTRLTAELPPLMTAIALRFGEIDAVSYHPGDWSTVPDHIDLESHE